MRNTAKLCFVVNNILLLRNWNYALVWLKMADRFPELSESNLTSLVDQNSEK